MSDIKKSFVEIIEYLQENKNKKVSSVLDRIVEYASKKTTRENSTTHIRDTNNNVVGIRDWYFKTWMPITGENAVKFGTKANTSTGLNTMCKEGVRNWSKQRSVLKKAKEQLLIKVTEGEILPSDIPDETKKIEAEASIIKPTELTQFETQEELIEHLTKQNLM